MANKIDISSTVLEKSIDTARHFLDKLVSPAVEEVGLLIRDTVALWKFNNQVRILNKAKDICEKNSISPKVISLKLLCPLLDGAALEEDPILQDKWAILLANMVDSDQNIENHVFPYILSQISTNEFIYLEKVLQEKKAKLSQLSEDLYKLRTEMTEIYSRRSVELIELSKEINFQKSKEQKTDEHGRKLRHYWSKEIWDLESRKQFIENELRSLKSNENSLIYRMKLPQVLPEEGLRDFELSNIIRLGIAKFVQETYANPGTVEIPSYIRDESMMVDVEIEVESNESHILTELGELFLDACTEKTKTKP